MEGNKTPDSAPSTLPDSIKSKDDLKKIIQNYDNQLSIEKTEYESYFTILSKNKLTTRNSISNKLSDWNAANPMEKIQCRNFHAEKLDIPEPILNLLFQWSTPPEEKKKEQEGEKSFF